MDEQNLQIIKDYLQRKEVQKRIQIKIREWHSKVTVSIGKTHELVEFSENQLRKWEGKGLLQPEKTGTHRYYSLQDLEKLAIIRVLMDDKFPLRTIPLDIDSIWHSILKKNAQQSQNEQQDLLFKAVDKKIEHLPINLRIENARDELFWRYYASHVLQLSLSLISETFTQHNNIGLILPLLANSATVQNMINLDDLPTLGQSLVGWLSQSGSSHTLLTHSPSFEPTNYYRIYHLQELENGIPKGYFKDNTLIITNQRAQPLTLSNTVVSTIERLLSPLYEDVQLSLSCFGQGMRDVLHPSTDLNSNYSDKILSGLANIVVRLGTKNGQTKWRFCCILLPDDNALPLQQRSLIVRAQSSNAPYKVGETLVTPNDPTLSISLRAYQSGQIIYKPEIYGEDTTVAFIELEKPGSVIAVPAGEENGVPIAVIYIVSDEPHAINVEDQRVLRFVGKILEELIITYRTRRQAQSKLTDLITNPEVIDTLFAKETENEFVKDIETFLKNIQRPVVDETKDHEDEVAKNREGVFVNAEPPFEKGLSIIAIDIDGRIFVG